MQNKGSNGVVGVYSNLRVKFSEYTASVFIRNVGRSSIERSVIIGQTAIWKTFTLKLEISRRAPLCLPALGSCCVSE
jgi:hypothetical protein